jgi:hypothetical protein
VGLVKLHRKETVPWILLDCCRNNANGIQQPQPRHRRIASPLAASYFDRSVNSDSMYATEG